MQRPSRSFEQTFVVGESGCLDPARDAELGQDVRHVDAGGLRADEQEIPYLGVGPALRDEAKDLQLQTGGDLVRPGRAVRGHEVMIYGAP